MIIYLSFCFCLLIYYNNLILVTLHKCKVPGSKTCFVEDVRRDQYMTSLKKGNSIIYAR